MRSQRRLFRVTVLASWVLLSVGSASRAAQPTTGVAAELKTVRTVLEKADHDYDGHRAKAVGEVTKAIHALKGTGVNRAMLTPQQRAALRAAHQAKAVAKQARAAVPPVHEAQALSDQQLNAALQALTQIAAQMGTAAPVAQQHVANAIGELKTALAIK